jgi:hypothetical protein
LITFAKQNPPADWRAPFSDLIKAALTGKRGGLGKVLAMLRLRPLACAKAEHSEYAE